MRLAFQHLGNDLWIAGNLFLENLFLALRGSGANCPTLILVADQNTAEREYGSLVPYVDEVLRGPVRPVPHDKLLSLSLRYHLAWWARTRLLRRATRLAPQPMSTWLPGHQVDALFSVAWTEAPLTAIPTVMWIPDFQHVRLPDMFTPLERASRDGIFRAQTRLAARLLVTSQEVLHDLQAFAPDQAGKARRLEFVAHIPDSAYAGDPRDSLAAYHLPEKFIYLPNQFWKHKNHRLVFEALNQLGARGLRPCLVSTGNPIDFRQPDHFPDLMQSLSHLNIREQFIYLGIVPRSDVFRLIRQSVCVLNPSKFEGLGLSVAESKSIGKRVLVSDLASLREQAAPGAVYFSPDDAADLAAKLESVWMTASPGPDQALEAAARAELPRRQTEFGRDLLQVFHEAQTHFRGQSVQ